MTTKHKVKTSSFTVRKHIENTYKKLKVHSKMEAVMKAQKRNLI
ncbi:LuxR C-terminal-related transcriptional regulator [Polaribacter aestuariivivens]|nr:LuxR C-terminal-related transcriptional regulator [Polaribacter aestuariivivens]